MTHRRRGWTMRVVGMAAVSAAMLGCDSDSPTTPAATLYVVSAGTDGNFRTIADAMKVVPDGQFVEVRGVIGERVVINRAGIQLRGKDAVLDGAMLDGRGIGIHITAPNVQISGFTVRNFERGIVVENTSGTLIQENIMHSNNSKAANSAPPLAPGVDLFEGIVLIGASNTQILNNVMRNNGHDGLMILGNSRNNVVRANRVMDNGFQTEPGRFG